MSENSLVTRFQKYDPEDINFVNMVCHIRGIESPFVLMVDLYDEVQALRSNGDGISTVLDIGTGDRVVDSKIKNLHQEIALDFLRPTLGSIKKKFYDTFG